jgi:hypothetical protein
MREFIKVVAWSVGLAAFIVVVICVPVWLPLLSYWFSLSHPLSLPKYLYPWIALLAMVFVRDWFIGPVVTVLREIRDELRKLEGVSK